MQQGDKAIPQPLLEDEISSRVSDLPKLTFASMKAWMSSCFQIRQKLHPSFIVPLTKTTSGIAFSINSGWRTWRAVLLMITA